MYGRLYNIFTKEGVEKLHKANILLVGVGGVGSFCFEALIRSGIQNITVVDFDEYEDSNLNRQLHSNIGNIGMKKVHVLKEYAKGVNKDINVTAIDAFLDDKSSLDISKYDYIIDAVDSIRAKVYLINEAVKHDKKIICSMGIGNRLDSSKVKVSRLDKTFNDPLAKRLRAELKKLNISPKIKVVFSEELPVKSDNISSYMVVTAYAGLLLADTVIKDIVHE